MRKWWQFRSVRTRLIFWYLMVAMVPVISVIGLLYEQRSEVIRGREFEKLQTIRDLKVRELNNWLDERTRDIQIVAGDHEIRELEAVWDTKRDLWNEQDRAAVDRARQLLFRFLSSYKAYHELFVMNAHTGEIVVSSRGGREGLIRNEDPYLTEVLRTRKIFIKDIYDSRVEGKPSMSFSAPLFCTEHEGAHLFGVFVARINLEYTLYPLLQEDTGFGKTGETLIVNNKSVALNKLRWHDNAPLRLMISAKHAMEGAAGNTGITETHDYRGEMVLAAYTHIPRTGWGFVAKRDLAEIYTPIREMVKDMGVILGISFLVVFIVALLLGRMVARPIVAIAATAGQIREGDFSARCVLEGADELAELAVSFNQMADNMVSQISIQTAGSEIANAPVAAKTTADFASVVVKALMAATGSNIGAYYQRDRTGRSFELVTSTGLEAGAPGGFDAETMEGEFGQALASEAISYTSNISAETTFTFKAVAGTAMPGEIVTIPLKVGDEVQSVISLATLARYTTDHRGILAQVHLGLNTALSNVLASSETSRMAMELGSMNEELQATNEELQKQTEELSAQSKQVEAADRLKSEFLSNMSHELRTPLNSVLALSQLMLARGMGKDPRQESEYLKIIERNGRQLLDLINDILDLSKIEAGQQEIMVADLVLGKVIRVVADTARPLAHEKGLELKVQIPETLPIMYSDKDKVRQILLNLLSNAIKFTSEGSVGIGVAHMADGVAFTVTDTGQGISPEDQEHIFEEFRQVDGTTTRQHGGTGLGLAISRRLSRLLGGDIAVISEPGQGSAFTLTLPLRCASQSSVTASAHEPPRRSAESVERVFQGNPHILVVEDNEVAAIQIRSVLEDKGCKVTVADGGTAGLQAVAESVPDAMVLDLMMPGVDGFQVLEQIRSLPETERLPVLVLTAKQITAEDRARLKYNNVQELIQKGSLNRDELMERIAALVAPPVVRKRRRSSDTEIALPRVPPGVTILVVEDNPDNVLTIKALLDEMGAGHVTVGDGKQAVRAAREERPDLILMDIQLPVMNGLDATRAIKAAPELRRIPVIALTARAMTGDREEILAAGCDDYLPKPLDPAALGEMILKWLEVEGE